MIGIWAVEGGGDFRLSILDFILRWNRGGGNQNPEVRIQGNLIDYLRFTIYSFGRCKSGGVEVKLLLTIYGLLFWAAVGNCIERGWALGDEKRMGAGGNDY